MKQTNLFNGEYTLYEDGRVYSNKSKKFLKPYPQYRGYILVELTHKGSRQVFTQHKLVAIHFLNNPNKLKEVNHKDGNKANNHVSNLEWCTHAENMKHASRENLLSQGKAHPYSKLTDEMVRQIRKLKGILTSRAIAKKFGVHPATISQVLTFRNWKHVK